MATSLRIATFNCENLFSRPKVFETTAAKSQKILRDVAELEAELRRDPFDKKKIKSLQTSLKGFATLNEVRGHLTSQSVKGPKDFLGWVELTRSENTDAAVENTARLDRIERLGRSRRSGKGDRRREGECGYGAFHDTTFS